MTQPVDTPASDATRDAYVAAEAAHVAAEAASAAARSAFRAVYARRGDL